MQVRALAQCLPFADNDAAVPPVNTVGHPSAFLSLARTCRSAYQLLTSDAACWATLRLHFDMNDRMPFHDSDFSLAPDSVHHSRLYLDGYHRLLQSMPALQKLTVEQSG